MKDRFRKRRRKNRRYQGFLSFAMRYFPYCQWCENPLVLENDAHYQPRSMIASTDHLIPQSLGGTDDWFNLVISCKQCNEKKSNIYNGPIPIPFGPENWEIVRQVENTRRNKRKKKKGES